MLTVEQPEAMLFPSRSFIYVRHIYQWRYAEDCEFKSKILRFKQKEI
jgi:hypothetical protein